MRRSGNGNQLLEGSILKHVVRLATPMIIAFAFITSYHYIDRYFVSRLGDLATDAIGLAFTLQIIIIAIGTGVGSGINSFVARNIGAGNIRVAKNAIWHAFALGIGIGLMITVVGLLIERPLFRLLGAEGAELRMILDYLTVILLFAPVSMTGVFANSLFQGWGDTMSPMKFMLTGNLLNLILDPLLIFGFGPYPDMGWFSRLLEHIPDPGAMLGMGDIPQMGMMGAALATGLGRTASLIYILIRMFLQHRPVKLSPGDFQPSREIVQGVFQVGAPSSLSQILNGVAMMFIFFVLDPFGVNAKAAYTIVFTYEMIIFLPVIGISQAVVILTGHNFGAQLFDRLRRTYRTGIMAASMMMIFSAGIIALWAPTFAGIFARSEAVLRIGIEALRIVAVGDMFIGIYMCSVASFQGLGLGRQYLWANLLRLYVLQIPFALLGAYLFQLQGVWVAMAVVNVISAGAVYLWHQHLFRRWIVTGVVKPVREAME